MEYPEYLLKAARRKVATQQYVVDLGNCNSAGRSTEETLNFRVQYELAQKEYRIAVDAFEAAWEKFVASRPIEA